MYNIQNKYIVTIHVRTTLIILWSVNSLKKKCWCVYVHVYMYKKLNAITCLVLALKSGTQGNVWGSLHLHKQVHK